MTDGPRLTLDPIGVFRSPHEHRRDAPRQPRAAAEVGGRIELTNDRSFDDALADLEGFSHLWVLFWFHKNEGWRPKVRPPRSTQKRGVFATRSPYRPNPLGLSVVRLERVEGLVLHVTEVDVLDGTPVFDLKPYIPWADAIPDARAGWLEDERIDRPVGERPPDPRGSYDVELTELVREQLAWLADAGEPLERELRESLALGPHPHAYRRIRPLGDGTSRLAVGPWRFLIRPEGTTITVLSATSGYRRDALRSDDPALELHRAFLRRFGL